MFLPLEILCQIIEYLSLKFLIFNKKLVKNYIDWQDLINNKFRKILSKRLQKIGIDGNEFCHILQKYNGVMIGSFLSHCILNEEPVDKELDIKIYSCITNYIERWIHNQYKGKFIHYSIGNIFRVPPYIALNVNI